MKHFFLLAISLFTISVFAQTEKYHRVKIDISEKGIMELSKAGIAVDHGEYKKGFSFTSDLSDTELNLVKQLGYKHEIQIADVANFYAHQNDNLKTYNPHNEVASTGVCNSCSQYQTPANFNLGSMGGFFTFQEMLDNLDSMAAKFPNLISVRQQIGSATTVEGNMLYSVKISDNPNVNESEPEVLYTSLHHAREAESLSQLIFYMWYLLENYDTNPEVQYLVNNLELYFIPCVNPDGYIYNETTNPNGGGMWRKNRRNNGNGTFGVDLNRNYGDHWGYDNTGSSPNSSSDTYRGPSAFSEIETQLVRDFCNAHEFKLALNNHTYGNLLVYPYGYIASLQTPDSAIFQNFAKNMTKCSGFSYGTGDETVGYVVNGDSDDWMYSEQSSKPMILSMTPEAGKSSDGFWPAINRIIDIAKETMDQNLSLAKHSGAYAEIQTTNEKFITSTNSYINYNIKRFGLEASDFTTYLMPISANITSGSAAQVHTGMTLLESLNDSISITLDNAIEQGDTVKYAIGVSNGFYTDYDTIIRIYGQPVIAFSDDCNTSSAFNIGSWGISTTQFVSANGSVADSPFGNYTDNNYKSVTTLNTIDLTNAIAATLSYSAKWDIEKGYDYVEVLASTDGGVNYTQLCGKYTAEGSDNQNSGAPMYDGRQLSWVKENIDLVDYLGQNIKLGFKLVSDGFETGDGFYFDDITVLKIINNVSVNNESKLNIISPGFPNPCSTMVNFTYSLPSSNTYSLKISDALGRTVIEKHLENNSKGTSVDVSKLTNGVYFYKIVSADFSSTTQAIVVMHE